MAVHCPKNDAEFAIFEQKHKYKTMVIDFYDTQCTPCKIMAPIFEEEADGCALQGNDNVVFAKVDIVQCEKAAAKYEIDVLPTFIIIKEEKVISSMVGASKTKLPKFIRDHITI